MGPIRPFVKGDIPSVVDLYERVSRRSDRTVSPSLRAYFTEVYFHTPWHDEALPSLVYQENTGKIVGFLGVMPRRMSMHSRPVRVALGAQLMVEPGSRTTLAGLQLTETFLCGSQDLSLIDGATDYSRQYVVVGLFFHD